MGLSRQRSAMKVMRVMRHLCYKEWLSQLALFSLDKTRLQGDLISMLQDLKRAYRSNVYKSIRELIRVTFSIGHVATGQRVTVLHGRSVDSD